MKIKVIAFDADDTLWDYEIIYQQARPQILNLFRDHHDPEEDGETHRVCQISEVEQLGDWPHVVVGLARQKDHVVPTL